MFGSGNQDYWMVTPEESRQFVDWLKSLFGMKTDKEKSSEDKSEKS